MPCHRARRLYVKRDQRCGICGGVSFAIYSGVGGGKRLALTVSSNCSSEGLMRFLSLDPPWPTIVLAARDISASHALNVLVITSPIAFFVFCVASFFASSSAFLFFLDHVAHLDHEEPNIFLGGVDEWLCARTVFFLSVFRLYVDLLIIHSTIVIKNKRHYSCRESRACDGMSDDEGCLFFGGVADVAVGDHHVAHGCVESAIL